jgi:malate/lactate dehydrogenase
MALRAGHSACAAVGWIIQERDAAPVAAFLSICARIAALATVPSVRGKALAIAQKLSIGTAADAQLAVAIAAARLVAAFLTASGAIFMVSGQVDASSVAARLFSGAPILALATV